MSKKIFKTLIRGLRICFFGEKQMPKVPLARKHMKNCELLLDRLEMLSKLKKGGKVAEIGVARGEFSELILKITEPDLLHLVDVWNSKTYHAGLFKKVADKFKNLIDEGRIQILRKLSTDAAEDFDDNYFDWIYIDTDHSYATTREELVKYAPKVKHDGIIAGHDYTMGIWISLNRYRVIEAVHEFCVKYGWELVYLTVEPTENQSFAIRRIKRDSPG